TYDIFAAYWPYVSDPNDPIAGPFNRVTKYVASRSEPKLLWQNSRLLGKEVVAALKTLKGEDGPDLLVQGSSNLLQTLWKNRLVDEFSVLIFPLLLGKGKRLFGEGAAPSGLKLVSSKAYPTGVIVAKYAPAGEVNRRLRRSRAVGSRARTPAHAELSGADGASRRAGARS